MILQHHSSEKGIARKTEKILVLPVGGADDDVRPAGFDKRNGILKNLRHMLPNDGEEIIPVRKI